MLGFFRYAETDSDLFEMQTISGLCQAKGEAVLGSLLPEAWEEDFWKMPRLQGHWKMRSVERSTVAMGGTFVGVKQRNIKQIKMIKNVFFYAKIVESHEQSCNFFYFRSVRGHFLNRIGLFYPLALVIRASPGINVFFVIFVQPSPTHCSERSMSTKH